MPNLYVALTHYPVVNKRGEIIASALTNLDLHDIARASKTFGVKSFYVVTPLSDQKLLAEKIIAIAMSAMIKEYSMAVAPEVLLKKREKKPQKLWTKYELTTTFNSDLG